MNEVTLPWPSAVLNPNDRSHWRKKSPIAKAYRHACWALALEAKLQSPEGDVHLWIDFYPPDKRPRDQDNMLSSMKSGLDGLADALGVNDRRFRLHPYVQDQIGGMVKIRITAGPHQEGAGGVSGDGVTG